MARITVIFILILCAATQQGRGNEITEKGLSLLGYHLCNYSLTTNVFKMVAYQKSYEKNTSCGGWIPWMICPRTYYKTHYHTVKVPETLNITDCCEGYEQVGLYCSLALNRSSVFASRPGVCPTENMETSDYPCTFDTECPGLKKCCSSSKGEGCVDPVPEEEMFWYNVTVLVKMDFSELIRVDPHLLNHSRLLHSMITGALQPLSASVYHIQSNHAEIYSGTVASQVLIGLHQPAPLVDVSSSLKDIVKRVYEVIDTHVQDVNECSYAVFNACPKRDTCINLEGYYSCNPGHEHADVSPQQREARKEGIVTSIPSAALDTINTSNSSQSISNSTPLSMTNQSAEAGCYPPPIINHRIFSVTSNNFEMSWHIPSTLNHTFQVQVFKDKEIVQNLKTEEMKMDVSGLEAGVMYSVEISYETCGKKSISQQNVKTEAKIFGVTVRILNYNLTEDLYDTNSSAYQEFSSLLFTEIGNSLPPSISALYNSGKLKVQIESLQAGSIIVRLRITVQDPEFSIDASTFAPMLSYLYNGSRILVDQQNTVVEDWDECASPSENDCSVFAECINLMGSYMCRCKTTMDTNPSRPGRKCEGEIVNPLTETMAPGVRGTTEMAPDVSTAGSASPALAKMEAVAAVGSGMSTTVRVPAVLPLTIQKLNGVVRITNVKYSRGFGNTSSKEYQNFARLFVDEVHKSLPPELLLKMDAGLIKVLITGITNGSTVVSFQVLIAEDVDVYYIITAFHDAFEHSSYFTVDKSDLSINDYDECTREEDDCSPDASCHNTLGFYECSCNEGFADVHPEKPGRNCEALPVLQEATVIDKKPVHNMVLPVPSPETLAHVSSPAALDSTTRHKALDNITLSSVVLPPYTTDPMSTNDFFTETSPVPLVKPAREVSIKDAVRVSCEIEKIILTIQKRFLQQESIPESSLYLGEPRCNVSVSNGTHVVLQAAWGDCGIEVQTNVTNTVAKTVLRNDISAQGVVHHLKVASPIHCVFQNDLLASSGYIAEGIYTIFEDLHGSGRFRTEMQLFIGNSPIPKNFSVSASDDVLIEVGIQRENTKLKVVLTDCWATPTNNSVDPFSFTFINNSCPIPNTYTTLLENGNSSKAQFKMKIFSFVNNSVVYLHCKVRICMETPESTCRMRCHGVRSLKTGETIATHRTSWGPLCKSAASDSKREEKAGLAVGYIILIVIAAFVFVLGVAGLFICRYQQKTGRYNFRIKSDNFSYQVFYD
ncbi:PREDICTED: uromodulin-like 1 [Tinamus guttatus]|uniref:uromodulin-like 1 n=1 Tax=Tinamus guttatus TaxID=94827 RepID=UPI00052ED727|nr:PREDICTED: uromodulin-like 1 [Tinamus guttatus]